MDAMMSLMNSSMTISGATCVAAATAALLTMTSLAIVALVCLYAGAGICKRFR